jgi:hypothetical protein
MGALFLVLAVARAQEASEVDLRKEVQNPVGSLTTVTHANILDLDAGPLNHNSYVLQTQVVTPFHLNESWLLVPRMIVNAPRYQPGATSGTSGTTGFGDSTLTFFISPDRVGRVILGVWPDLLAAHRNADFNRSGQVGFGASDWSFYAAQVGHPWLHRSKHPVCCGRFQSSKGE